MPLPLVAMAVGGLFGGLVSGGLYTWQHWDEGFSWGGLAANVAGGAVAGAATPVLAAEATLGWLAANVVLRSGIAAGTSVALGGLVTRIWENLLDGVDWWKGAIQTVALGFALGAVLGLGAGKFLAALKPGTVDSAANAAAVTLLGNEMRKPTLEEMERAKDELRRKLLEMQGTPTQPGAEPTGGVTQEQLDTMGGLCRASGLQSSDFLTLLGQVTGRPISDPGQLTAAEAEKAIAILGGRGRLSANPAATNTTGSTLSLGPATTAEASTPGSGNGTEGNADQWLTDQPLTNQALTDQPITEQPINRPAPTPGLVERLGNPVPVE